MSESVSDAADRNLARTLRAFVQAQLPAACDLCIEGLRRTSTGRSRENWVFDASWHETTGTVHEPLILRRDPAGSVLETDRRAEFAVLQALEHTTVPAPRVRWLDAEGEWFGRPAVVMAREEGVCEFFVVNGERPLEARVGLAQRFCDLLAAVHQVDWRRLGLGRVLSDPGPHAARAAVDHWKDVLRRHQVQPHPELEVVAAWLRATAPTAQATVLVHGDFKPGNALLRGDTIGALLDWETAHLGDPIEDLGWVTNPLRAREHQISGAWERQQICERYAARTGFAVTDQDLRWWNVLANYKLSIIALTGVGAFLNGRLDRVYHIPTPLFALMFDLIGA